MALSNPLVAGSAALAQESTSPQIISPTLALQELIWVGEFACR